LASILVTGGLGFIGTNLARALIEAGPDRERSLRFITRQVVSRGLGYDFQSGFGAYRGEVLPSILPQGDRMGADLEIYQEAVDAGLTVNQVFVENGVSSNPHKVHPALHLADLLVSRIRQASR
jgi:hypothetical protein